MTQTELTDFDAGDGAQCKTMTDGGQVQLSYETRDDGKPVVDDAWEGEVIYTSWGYGQTNVNFARIVEVSDSGRTVKAQMATAERVDAHRTSESVAPTGETYGDEFRLYVRESRDDVVFRGSYPFVDGDSDNGTRKDTFLHWDEAKESTHQTAPGYGH